MASSRKKADTIVSAARAHKAFDLVLMDVGGLSSVTDFYFLCSCRSSRQVKAVTESIVMEMKMNGHRPLGVEGQALGQWVLVDFGEVVAHVFHEPLRRWYDLEGLWVEAPRVNLGPEDDASFSEYAADPLEMED